MLENLKNRLSILQRSKSVVYRLFSHRYLLLVVIVATAQMGLQLWFEGRALVVNRQGVGLLQSILETSKQPQTEQIEESRWRDPIKRSLHNQGPSLLTQLHVAQLMRRQGSSPKPAPVLTQDEIKTKMSRKATNTTARVPAQRLKVEPEGKKKPPEKKPNHKSSRTKLEGTNRDPAVMNLLQALGNQKSGNPGIASTTSLVAPGAAVFLLDGNLINLSAKCVKALNDLLSYVNRGNPTAIARIVFQIWLWGLTLWGLLLESIPHVGAVAASHVVNAAFLALKLRSTTILKAEFASVVNNDCDGVDLLPSFWQFLFQIDLVAVVFATIAVLAFAFLGFKISSVLDWRTFKKLGASRIVRMAHTFSLIFAAIVQLNAYFVVVFLALWLAEVLSYHWKAGSHDIQNTLAFKLTAGTLLGLSVPWLIIGNSSLKRENMVGIVVFLVYNVILLAFTIFLLCQKLYQTKAKCWIFLRFTGIMACMLMFASLFIASACLLVFDRGLLRKVNRESKEEFDSHSRPSMNDAELAFPNNDVESYSYYKSETSGFSEKGNSVVSEVSQPKAVEAPRMDYTDHSGVPSSGSHPHDQSVRQSWMKGDEVNWIATVAGRPSYQRNWSVESSNDGLSYATTTISQSTTISAQKGSLDK